MDHLRQRTGQQQVPQQSQYPNQDYGAPQQLWPREDMPQGQYQQPAQQPPAHQPHANGYASNGQAPSYGEQQRYGGNGAGGYAHDPYAQSYGAPADPTYPYANGAYPQQPAARGLPAPQASQPQRSLSQQAGLSYPQTAPQPAQQPARPARQLAPPQAAPQPLPQQPFSQYAPPSSMQPLPQSHPGQQGLSPTTGGRRAPDGASSGFGAQQPRQDAQIGLASWQQQQAPQQVAPSAAPRVNPAAAGYGSASSQPIGGQAGRPQPQSDMYGLGQGFPQARDAYGTPAQQAQPASQQVGLGASRGVMAPQQPATGAFGAGYAPQAGFPQQQQTSWGGGDDYSRAAPQPAPIQDFGFEAPLDTLGDSFGGRDGIAGQGHATGFDQSYVDDETEFEEEGSKRNWKKIAFLLGLFIAVGGSLALAYATLLGSPSSTTQQASAPPVIKGDERPTKVKPSDPGGKQFSYTDSKMLGRVGEGGAPQAAAGSSSGSGDVDPVTGARKVPLLTIGRDGTVQTQQPDSAPQQAASAPPVPGQSSETRAMVVVPGMTVIEGIGQKPLGAPTTTASTSPPAQQQGSQQPSAQPQAAKIITASEPQKPVVVSPPAAEKKVAAPPKKTTVAAADATAPTTSATAQPSPSVTGAGYVTVLASVPATGSSRDEAMRQFQGMQQKYASVLTGKVADVVEANLGDKGTYHRLIAGPPGSKESANQLCNDLKAQGYAGCWVTAY